MSAKKPWEMDWPDEKEKKPWEMDWDDEPSPAVDLASSHETPPAPPRRNVVKERLEFERQRSGKPLADTDPARLQEISASDPTVDPNLERLSKMGFRRDVDQFAPKTNAGPLGLVPSHGPAPPPKVSLGRKAADFVGIGGATTAQAALTGVGQMLGGAADTGRSLGDVGAMAFTDEAGGPRLTGDDFAGRKPGSAAPVTWGSGGPVGRGLDWARQTLREAGDQVADSPKVLEAKRILSQVESGEIGDVVPTLLENPNAIAALGGSAAGSLIPQIAAATVTPGLAVAPMFFQELAGIEEQQRAHEQETGQNMDPLERFGRQAGSSAAIAALERIVPGEIAGALQGRAGGAARALMTPLKEGATEAAQRGIADYFATEEGQLNPAGMLMEGLAGGMGGAAVAPAHMGPAYEGPEVKGRDYGDEFLKHRKNVAAYKSAKEKAAAQEKHAAGREELGKLEDQLQAVVNQAGETQDPKAAKAAAALKQKADSLRVELGQVQLAPLSKEDELWVARGAPKFGDALGGGATEAASVEGRAFRGTDENGRPLRLGYSIDEVEAKLSQWREVDPKLGTTNVVVHDSILSPDFFDGLTPEVQERVKRAVANGIDPAELSSRSPIPGFYRNGETHVLAPALISLDHLNELVSGHELTHDVIDNLQPDEVVQLFGRGGKVKALGALARRAAKKDQLGYTVGQEYADETPEVQGEEVLAGATEYAGTRGPASRLDQARAAVKDRLRAALPDWAQGVLGAASDAEIRVLLDRTRQIAAKRAKSGSVTVAGRGPQKATAPAEGKAPSLTQLGQAINDAIPDAVALEAAMRQIQSDDPDTIMAGIDALLATNAAAVPPGMKPQAPAQQPQEPTRRQAQPLPEPSVDVDEMLATQEANDRARLQAERDEAAARADAAEKALKVLEAQRKAEQDQKAKDAKAAKDAEAGRAVLEQLPDEEARRAEEARTQRLLDAARSGDVDPSGALTPAIHQFLGQDAMDRVLANPLGPETPRTKSLKKQPPGTAPTEAVPPTTVPPAAGELQPEAPTGKAPKKGGKARLSIRGGIYEGQERRQERDRRIADVLRKSPDQLTREDILALHEHASENPKSGLPSEAVWNARDHTGKHISVIDVDGLGYLNDKHGFDAGDAMLQAVGHVSRVVKGRHPGVEHYHISGDEFRAEAGSREEADAYSDDLRETLKKTRFLITDGRGVRHVVTGLSTSHGVDITPELADRQMKGDTDDATLQPNSKRARQLRGERAAKGERPPGVTVDPLEGRAGSAPGVLGLATRSDQDRRDRDAGAADEVGTPVKHSRRQEETPEFRAWSRGAPVVDLSETRPRERLARESRQGEIRDGLGARAQRAKEWLGRDKGPEEASRYTALGYDFYAQEFARNGGDEQAALEATIDLGYTPPTKGMSREEAMRQDVESHELERQGHQEAVDRWRAVEDDAKGNPPNANTLVETGKPVVLPAFHGTTSAGFAAFSKKMLGRETAAPSAKEAFFFTSQPDLANVYAKEGDTRGNVYGHVRGSGVYKTYVRMENPLVVDDAGRGRTPGMGYYGHIAEAKRQGRDGVIFLNTYDGGQEEAHVFAVFDNKQVKSALGNVGAFGQRAPTPEEAASLGMTWRGAKAAQTRGDIRFSMRGASAQDADRKKLRTAQKMILAGQDEEKVRKETGWHQGTDKRWRWEGDDSQARIVMEGYRKIPYVADPGRNDGVPLGSVLQYDSMYRSYPEVANIRVVNAPRPIGSTVASFNEKTNVITLFPAVDGFEGGPLQAFLHEVQHWVQTKEAFAAGGNADTVLELIPPEDSKKIAEDAAVRILKQSNYHRDNVAALEEVIRGYEYHRTDEGSRVSVENVPDALGMSEAGKRRYLAATRWGKSTGDLERDLSDERRSIANIESRAEAIRTATGEELKKVVEQYGDAHGYYLRLAGEEEARQTQKRANLTPAERAERDPRLDFDNPPERQIVDMRRGSVRRSRRQESTPEFKEWFGDWEDPKAFSSKREPGKEPVSQAVDASGRPLVVYHGTRGDFGTFNTRTRGYNSNVFGSWETDRHAAFFAEKPTDAEAFTESGGDGTGGNIRPVYLNAKAPIDFTRDGAWFEDFLSEMEAEGVNPRWIRNSGKTWELFDGEDGKRFVEAAKKIGYDSVIFDDSNPDTGDSFRAWVVFDPEQIKSATGNDGTFSKTDPDIRRSRRNSAEAQLSWEAVPGMNTGRLTGIHDAPYEIRAAFTTDMGRHFKDAKGRDVIAPAFGLKETDQISVPGYYLNSEGKEERNPSRQLFLQLPDSPDAMDKLAGYAAARGYVLRQEAVGVHVARNLREGEAENGYFVEMGSVPTEAQYEAYVSAMTQAAGEDAFKFVAVPTHGGINLWTWDDSISPTEIARINDAASAAVDSDVTMQARPIKVDSRYIENDWSKEAPNGEGYIQQITAAGGPPDLQARLDQLRKAADGTAEEWAKRHGWGAHKPAPVTPVDARIPRDVEALVGRDVKSTGQTKRNLFQQIANVVNGKDLREMRLAAESGRAMKGWYRDSAAAVRKLFGEDTEAFVATLAALSPRQGVRENLKMAVAVWEEWDKRGRPTDPEKIREMFPRIGTVLDPETGKMREKHALVDMGGRIPNVVTALSTLGSQELSGAKVESFRRNLLGDFDAVTNDTWMAQFADISQSVFGKPAGYLAGSYMVRRVAKQLGWTPAEVQETVWTFFRELRARTDSPLHRTQEGHRLTTATDQALAMSNADVIRGADSFAHLVRDPNVRDRLQRLGIDVEHLSEPTRLGDDATHLAVRKEARDSRVLGRIAGRVQRASDSAWANKQLAISRIHKLPDADPAVLRDIARIVGVPIAGRSGPQIARALQAYRDPAKYSRRLSDDPDWDLPLTPPQVEARVARLGAVEDSLAADKPGYEVKRLEREKDRPWTKVGPEAEKLDLVTDDDQWVRLASRKGRVLSDAEQQAINSRVQLRHDEMKTLVEKLEEATALSKDEAAARGIDVQALVKEEMAARLAYVAMERASVNAGTQAGRALAARRRIMAAGSDVTPDAMLRRIIKELPDVDKADAADLYRVYHQSPAEFTNALRLVMKPGAFRKGMEYWKAGLLSGLGTHVANVAGNTIEPAAQLAETLVAAGIDKAWSARTGKPRERFVGEARYELRGQLKALPMAFSRFVDEFKAQILRQEEPDISAAGPLEYQVGAIGPGWGAIPFDVGKAVRTPFRALTISDRFFKALGYEAELYKLAYRQARKDGFVGEKADQRADQIIESARQSMGDHWRSMVEQADEGMKQRVFQGEPVKIIRSLMTLAREHPAAGFMFPFLRTPAEITRRGWQRSPMGLVGGRRGATSAEYDRQQAGLEAKGGHVVGKGEVSDAWARPLVGTALATAFSGLAAIGMLTGGGPVDKDKKKLKLATGWQPYSVRIPKGGGKYLYLPYTRFEPLSSLLGIVADAFETGDERKVGDKIMGSIAQNYTNKQFWKGLNDFATAITSPDRSAKTVITPIVASALVPAVVAKTAEAIDPTFREKRSDPGLTGLAESTARATLRRVPGVSRGEEPIYTPLGDPAQRPGNAVTRFASPVQPSTTKAGTELEDWLVKINEAPSPIPGEVAIPKELLPRGGEYDQTGTRIVLTNEERAILAKSRRDAASILRRDLESIKRMPLDDQRDRIQKAFKGAQREAISKLWLRSPELRERARKQVGARR